MTQKLTPVDCDGELLLVGDRVLYARVTDHLLSGLPEEDQEAIKAQAGKVFELSGFDDYGYAEIEFEHPDKNGDLVFHTIWIEPANLKKAT